MSGDRIISDSNRNEFPEYLLEKNQQETPANLALFHAALNNDVSGVQSAISNGGKVDFFHRKDDSKNALHVSAEAGSVAVVDVLLRHGAHANAIAVSGHDCALTLCAHNGHVEVASMLIDHGADVNLGNGYGNTPLHEACLASGSLPLIQLLLRKGADVNAENHKGSTPLHFLCYGSDSRTHSVEMARELIGAGADVNRKDHRGMTPILVCCSSGRADLIDCLLAVGADSTQGDGEGRNAHDIAVFYNHESIAKQFALESSNHLSSMSALIDSGSIQTVEQLVYQNRLVSLHAHLDSDVIAYCVKEFDQSTRSSAINVFAHSIANMRSTRLTNNHEGASHGAVVVSGVNGTEDMVCFLQNGAVWSMAVGGGCQRKLAGGEENYIEGFKIFTGLFNRIWMLAVVNVSVLPIAQKTPSKATGMLFDKLMIRHWTEWDVYSRRHHLLLFELAVTPDGLLALREDRRPVDIMHGLETDCPGKAPGDGDEDYSVNPDGTLIAMSFRRPQAADETGLHKQASDFAWTTDTAIYISEMSHNDTTPVQTSPPRLVSGESRTYKKCPKFSPNGRYLAFLAMDRPCYESDKQSIVLYDVKTELTHTLTLSDGQHIDMSFGSICWGPSSDVIFTTAVFRGANRIFKLTLSGICATVEQQESGQPIVVISLLTMHGVKSYSEPRVVRTSDGDFLYYMQSSLSSPNELMRLQLSCPTVASIGTTVFAPLTEYDNPTFQDISDCIDGSQAQLRAQYVHSPCPQYSNGDIAVPTIRQHYFKGAGGDMVHAFYLPPVSLNDVPLGNAKVPLLLIVHGGPQGAIMNSWNFRWNLSLFAAQGYGVLAVNFHGSIGYGQAFADSIHGDWGGGPYQDCMLGIDYILSQYSYLDESRMAALGASYGGYMINWMNGHTDRFKCLVNHDGIFSLRSFYYVTDELFFPEWEFGKPWTAEGSAEIDKWSPDHFVAEWKTPTLVVQGGRDYRVCDGEGIATFTALQRRGISSRMLYFEDEGHWVMKPHNSEMWYLTVFDWLNQWLRRDEVKRG